MIIVTSSEETSFSQDRKLLVHLFELKTLYRSGPFINDLTQKHPIMLTNNSLLLRLFSMFFQEQRQWKT